MKVVLPILAILFLSGNVFCDSTFVQPGPIATIDPWTPANSPYCVTGNVSVSLLTIEPGVTIIFLGEFVFEVTGTLTAIGTEQDSIKFTKSDTANGWQGIFFNSTPIGSELKFCVIEHSVNSGIRIVNSSAAIDNCTISNNSTSNTGGGIFIDEINNDSLLVKNCVISNNTTLGQGGGIKASITTGTLKLDGCLVANNSASSHGGGISAGITTGTLKLYNCDVINNVANPQNLHGNYVGGGININGDVELINCSIKENTLKSKTTAGQPATAISRGGGIYVNGSATFTQCTIQNNTSSSIEWSSGAGNAYSYGGGIYLRTGISSLTNCIVSCNYDTAYASLTNFNNLIASGTGIYVLDGTVSIENCTVVNNNGGNDDVSTSSTTNGLRRDGGTVTVLNSILYFNDERVSPDISGTVTVTYSDVELDTGIYTGVGNINLNPSFTNTSCENEDLILLLGSSCIDAGNPDPMYNDPEDPNNPGFALWPAMGTVWNDMGAFGGPGATDFVVGIDNNQLSDDPILTKFELFQNYPNPFNPTTTIKYHLKTRNNVQLTIYDILGREIKTLVNQRQNAGQHSVNFNASDLASGVYIYKLKAGSFEQSQKLLLLR